MYTPSRNSDYLDCTTKSRNFETRKTGELPQMKLLLRTSIVALIIFAGYASLATDLGISQAGPFPRPPQCPTPQVNLR